MKYLPALAIATLLNVLATSCFAQTTAPATTTTAASKSDSTTSTTKQDKKAAKTTAKAKTNKPAGKMATTPSQEAAYALTTPKGVATQSQPPK
jgi:hypothetical protein